MRKDVVCILLLLLCVSVSAQRTAIDSSVYCSVGMGMGVTSMYGETMYYKDIGALVGFDVDEKLSIEVGIGRTNYNFTGMGSDMDLAPRRRDAMGRIVVGADYRASDKLTLHASMMVMSGTASPLYGMCGESLNVGVFAFEAAASYKINSKTRLDLYIECIRGRNVMLPPMGYGMMDMYGFYPGRFSGLYW